VLETKFEVPGKVAKTQQQQHFRTKNSQRLDLSYRIKLKLSETNF
jgi:hypothetical protein